MPGTAAGRELEKENHDLYPKTPEGPPERPGRAKVGKEKSFLVFITGGWRLCRIVKHSGCEGRGAGHRRKKDPRQTKKIHNTRKGGGQKKAGSRNGGMTNKKRATRPGTVTLRKKKTSLPHRPLTLKGGGLILRNTREGTSAGER